MVLTLLELFLESGKGLVVGAFGAEVVDVGLVKSEFEKALVEFLSAEGGVWWYAGTLLMLQTFGKMEFDGRVVVCGPVPLE
jgi:hypothetical protein